MSRAFTVSGVRVGSFCSMIAAVPATAGVAMLVPLKRIYCDVPVTADIARRDHDDDALLTGGLHGLAERIAYAALVDRPAQREIDHTHVVFAFQRHGLLDGGDYDTIVAHAVPVEHSQVEKTCV